MWSYTNPNKPYRLVSFVRLPTGPINGRVLEHCSVGMQDYPTFEQMMADALHLRLEYPMLYTTRAFQLKGGRWRPVTASH